MGVSKAQKARSEVTCKCGCGKVFMAFPVYRPAAEGGGLRVPEYYRGHHPNCKKSAKAWNKGLKKGDHPSISRMGFQPGHPPYIDGHHLHKMLRENPEIRAKWLASKQNQIPWNKGLSKLEYKNGFSTGPEHGNWKGGHGGIRDTAEWQRIRREVQKRDNYTCQHCGDKNHKGRGSRIRLEVHHIVAIHEDKHKALDFSNLVTLCSKCHRKTHNFGSKALMNRRGK